MGKRMVGNSERKHGWMLNRKGIVSSIQRESALAEEKRKSKVKKQNTE
jgi:hypothetical protein